MTEAKSKEFSWVATDPGVRRRILAQRPEAMTVEFAFERGAVGALHRAGMISSDQVSARENASHVGFANSDGTALRSSALI